MQDKLKLLLEQMDLEPSLVLLFEGGSLDKIIGSKDREHYCFYITLKSNLPVSAYQTFLTKLKKTYDSIPMVTVKFQIVTVNSEYIKEYFDMMIDEYAKSNITMSMYKENPFTYEDGIFKLEVSTLAEQLKIEQFKKEMEERFQTYGYPVTFETVLNEESNEEIASLIAQSLVADIPDKIIKPVEKAETSIILGEEIKGDVMTIHDVIGEDNNIIVEAKIFGTEYFESAKTSFKIITLKITDMTDSIYCKVFVKDDDEYGRLKKALKEGTWLKIRGYSKNDQYAKELVLNARDINLSNRKEETRSDTAEQKRVELHTHTMMSQMDGLVEAKKIIKQAYKWGHRAIAITDHNCVQAFPDAYHTVCDINKGLKEGEEPFKVLYGTELTLIDDNILIVVRPNDSKLLENTYVVFDFETTGFNAAGGDQIIEIGAVKILNGEIIERYDKLIDPGHPLPPKITELTGITDEMLKGQVTEEEAIKDFIAWFKDMPMVAHNARFDVSFLEMAYKKYNLGEYTNTVIDTLELSRTLDSTFSRHGLSALVKRYDVPFDEDSHHRGDYDAEATALVYHKMMKKLVDRNIETIHDLNKLVAQDEIYKFGRSFHVNLIAQNKVGLKNLFKIISLANTKYLYKTPRILRSEITRLREGILIGSGCYESEVFTEARSKSDEELTNIIRFYDYVEVQPLDCYDHLLQMQDFGNKLELTEHIKKIIRVCEDAGKLVVATGDVHHLDSADRIYRKIIVNQKIPGGGRHPLARNNIKEIPSNHFRTTDEMIQSFDFLDAEVAKRIIIENPNKIADMCEIIEVIIETGGVPFSPKIENSVETVKELVYGKAHDLYGDVLPELIDKRIDQELSGIIKGGFDVIYLIAQKLVKKSNDDGYLVGSRGSVGSSFVATMMGITEVNPLPAHYRCPNCKHSIFELDGEVLGAKYSSGFDLPDLVCPKCSTNMDKDGQDMPFATFLGFDADKVPDIDLNFSGDYQWRAHEYTKVLFGVDNVYRAGTIGTVADKTAFGYVKGYCEDNGIMMRTAEVERLAIGCTGVKRTTGQHPGGIVVIPGYMDVFDFTPFQYPADDPESLWRTTHFDYHAIDQDVLKLDILGHDDPTVLRMLQDLSKMDVTKVPFDDKEVMSIFKSPEVLGVTKEQIMCETGTLGIPEFGTKFVIGMLCDTTPSTFSELLKISGLSHGTDVWLGNAQELIQNKVVEFKDVIGCRDDIMVYLMYNGLQPKRAFKIMEFVRKGRASKDPDSWKDMAAEMKEAGIADWFIESCRKIKYMFPKAHAAAYVMSAWRIAWFKVHHPIWYYTAYFSVRCMDFDIEAMIKGYDAIKSKIIEIANKGRDASNKESATYDVLQLALEASARGIKFGQIDLKRSDSMNFVIDDDNMTLIPPFRTIDGLGDMVAKKIVEEREKGEFISIEDLQKRGKVSGTLIEKMRMMGILDNMDESSQLSLF